MNYKGTDHDVRESKVLTVKAELKDTSEKQTYPATYQAAMVQIAPMLSVKCFCGRN